jgi:ribosomal protein S18 acetylase RimI-like enzyme
MKVAMQADDGRFRILFFHKNQHVGHLDIEKTDTELRIWNFFIYKRFRSQGLGTKAIKRFVTIMGNKPLWLMVMSTNHNAISIYKKCGFVIECDNPWRVAYVMIRKDNTEG